MWRAALIAVAASGCGRIAFDATGDALPQPPPCGSTTVFADDFGANSVGSFWTPIAQTGMTIAQQGGVLRIMLAAQLPAGKFAGVRHAMATVVRDACATYELAAVPVAPGRIAYAELGDNLDGDGIGWRIENGVLSLESRTAGVTTENATTAHDPVAHRFLRLQQFGGTFVGTTSPTVDGPYVELGRVEDSGVALDRSSVSIGAVTETPPDGAAATIEWDSFSLVLP